MCSGINKLIDKSAQKHEPSNIIDDIFGFSWTMRYAFKLNLSSRKTEVYIKSFEPNLHKVREVYIKRYEVPKIHETRKKRSVFSLLGLLR